MKRQSGYLTVYLCLILSLLIPLYLVLIEGARRGGAGLEAACAVEAGMQSTLAEYHRELAEQFNLYAIDSSYGTTSVGRENTEAHLLRYISENLDTKDVLLSGLWYRDFFGLQVFDAEIFGAELLTDGGGSVFRKAAVNAVKDDVGLGLFQQVSEWLQSVQISGLDAGEEAEGDACLSGINAICGQISEKKAPLVRKPVSAIEAVRNQGILKLVLDEPVLSTKIILEENLAAHRMKNDLVNSGNLEQEQEGLLDKFLFREYLVRYCGDYLNRKENSVLDFETEYLLAGKNTDAANLKSVLTRLLILREGYNLAFLMSDEKKQEEISAVATAICAVVFLPELEPVAEGILAYGWSLAESIYDVKCLVKGGKIPLQKTDKTWHSGLQQVIDGLFHEQSLPEEGLSYRDYLRIFLMLTGTKKLTDRAMNLVEGDIRLTPKNEDFRLDACFTELKIAVRLKDARNREMEIVRSMNYE